MEAKRNMTPILIILITGIVIAGVVAFLVNHRQSAAPSSDASMVSKTNDTDKSDEGAPAPGERMTITFTSNGFQPNELTVKKGIAITVVNESSKNVEFSSADHPTHRVNPEMNLKVLAPGESASYTATKVGQWSYHDHLNAGNTGKITVTE